MNLLESYSESSLLSFGFTDRMPGLPISTKRQNELYVYLASAELP